MIITARTIVGTRPATQYRQITLQHGVKHQSCRPNSRKATKLRTIQAVASYKSDLGAKTTEHIASLQNPTVKHCVKLRTQKSYRDTNGSVLVVGADLVLELATTAHIQTLFIVENAPNPPLTVKASRTVTVSLAVMEKITGLQSVNPNTLAAELLMPHEYDFLEGFDQSQDSTMRLDRLLVLERAQDPGNMGTLLRTALALGWQGVVLLPGCADPYNDKAIAAARGAPFKLPIAKAASIEDWLDIVDRHKLRCIAGEAHLNAKGAGIVANESYQGVCLVLGSEGQGLSDEVLAHCIPVAIPMSGNMESLNVASAGAILMCLLSKGAPKLSQELHELCGNPQM